MSGFTRMKRVTDPLDDRVKARIVGRNWADPGYTSSSGSEHSAQADDDVTSPSLSDLVFSFGCDDGDDADPSESSPERNDSDSDSEHHYPAMCDTADVNLNSIKTILEEDNDAFKRVLLVNVLKAVQMFPCLKSNMQLMRRNVMAYLKGCGYDAAVCKTKWESSGGLTAGNYEFIDVVRSGNSTRYFVDLDFASEFEIARPTSSYEVLLQHLPRVFVGKSEDLKRILKVVSDAARRSMKSRGLLLPPWRKHRYMQNKWLAPYRRTVNLFPTSFSSPSPAKPSHGSVKCRAVGFDAAAAERMVFPSIARTR